MPVYSWVVSFYIAAYLLLLFFERKRRDFLAFLLVASLCIAFGLRAVNKLFPVQDPVIYSTLISRVMVSDVSFTDLGLDYIPLYTIQLVTFGTLTITSAFFLIHLLYLPFIFCIYRFARVSPGLFYILSGWMMFANSGVLLLCNFLRQGYAILFFLGLLLALSVTPPRARKSLGIVLVPLLHASAVLFAPALLLLRKRRYYILYTTVFIGAIAWICRDPRPDSPDVQDSAAAGSQLLIKVLGMYGLFLIGYLIQRNASSVSDELKRIERTAAGILLPGAALLLFGTPSLLTNGLRLTYWMHAVVFLYLSAAISSQKSEMMFRLSAIALCAFGIITWNHPNVAMLLVW